MQSSNNKDTAIPSNFSVNEYEDQNSYVKEFKLQRCYRIPEMLKMRHFKLQYEIITEILKC